jgi:hypothetical protein
MRKTMGCPNIDLIISTTNYQPQLRIQLYIPLSPDFVDEPTMIVDNALLDSGLLASKHSTHGILT